MIGRIGASPGVGARVTVALAAALLIPLGPAGAQEPAGTGWLPWLGCWNEAGEPEQLVCVQPVADAAAVELRTIRDGETVRTERLHADGVRREVAREGCEGTERTEFSSDGRRLHREFEHVCERGVERRGTGLIAMVSPSEWIRVETAEVAGETAAVTRRFRLADGETPEGPDPADVRSNRGMSLETARTAASSPPSVDELVEASRAVDSEAVKAWVAEQGEPLDVDADELARMADEGVDEDVIDVAVAVSFPGRFDVGREAKGRDRAAPSYGGGVYGPMRPGHPWARGYGHRGAFLYPFSPFGYGFRRPGWWYGRNRSTVVVVTPGDDDERRGRVVSGEGYTREPPGSARDPESRSRGVDRPSGSTLTPAGATAGGSSGSTDRKAKPRDESSSDDGDG